MIVVATLVFACASRAPADETDNDLPTMESSHFAVKNFRQGATVMIYEHDATRLMTVEWPAPGTRRSFTVNLDGSVTGDVTKPTGAARAFWRAFAQAYPTWCAKGVR